MSDKQPTPASGGGEGTGKRDGVNESDARARGWESGGRGYDNPQTGKDGNSDASGILGHSGQTEIGYNGGGQANTEGQATENATAEGSSDVAKDGQRGSKPGPDDPDQNFSAEYHREIEVDDRRLEIIDTSEIAATKAAGTIGRDDEAAGSDAPGSG